MDEVGVVGGGVVDGGLEDLEISADIREAKSMVCSTSGLFERRCLVGGCQFGFGEGVGAE